MSYKPILIILVLLGILNSFKSEVILSKYKLVNQQPLYGDIQCPITLLLQLTETVPGLNVGLTLADKSHPGYIEPAKYINQTTLTIRSLFILPIGYNNSIWFNATDENGSYRIYLPSTLDCNPLPSEISLTRVVPPYRSVAYYSLSFIFMLDFDVNLVVDVSSNPITCTPGSLIYTCLPQRSLGDFHIYVLMPILNANSNDSYWDPYNVTLQITFTSKTYTLTTLFESFYKVNGINRGQLYNPIVTTYPPVQSDFTLKPYQSLSTLFSVELDNVTSPYALFSFSSYSNYLPLLGNSDHLTYFAEQQSTYTFTNYVTQLSDSPIIHDTIVVNITKIPQDIKFQYENISDPSFYSLLQITNLNLNDFTPISYTIDSPYFQSRMFYPYGFTFHNHTLNGNDPKTNTNIEYHSTYGVKNKTEYLSISFYYRDEPTIMFFPFTPPVVTDTTPPILHSFELYQMDIYNILIVANISDDVSGVRYIKTGIYPPIYLENSLIKGDYLDGVYAFYVYNQDSFTEPMDVSIFDYSGKESKYDKNYFNINLDDSPYIHTKLITCRPWDFTYWKVFSNSKDGFDTSNGSINLTLFFNISTTFDKEMITPVISTSMLPVTGGFEPQIQIDRVYWDYTNNLFRIDFQVAGGSFNSTLYTSLGEVLASPFMETYWGQINPKIYSRYTDKVAPIITSWKVTPSSNVFIAANQSKTTIGFDVVVLDRPNGLKEGRVQFVSNIDGLPYEFQFNDTTRIAGDIYNGTYRFTIDIMNDTCVNQTFYLFSTNLTDMFGISSYYPNIYGKMSPFRYNGALFETSDMVTITCEQEPVDLVLPYIANFSFTPTFIDFRSDDRNITFTLTTRDDESGLSPRHNPVIYLAGILELDILRIDYKSKTIHNTSSTTYQYSTTLPYAFSPQNVLVSVYGIADNYLNLKGYSSLDLKNVSWGYFIETRINTSTITSIINNSTNRLYQHGGQLTIMGRGLGNDLTNTLSFVDYQDGRGFVQVPILILQHVISIIQVDQVNNKFIMVKYKIGSLFTNSYRVDRTEYQPVFNFNGEAPPEPPQPLVCSNNCSGNGNCTFNGCVCQDPWYGPSCSTKTIIVPPPITNTSDPVIIIDTGGGNGDGSTSTSGNSTTSGGSTTGGDNGNNQGVEVKSIISIYSLREITLDGKMVNEFFPSNWTFNNETNIDGSNGLKFHYSSKLKDRDTIFNVTIQYFTNQSIIEFAGQPITLPPYSTKMSMSLDGYKFNSYLNNLQIIMNIELMTPNQGVQCTSKQYGLGGGNIDDLQWMKLNIDDKSLYGNFIRRGIIDGRVTSIKNSLLDSVFNIGKSQQSQQTYIGINIPTYRTSAVIDPDFSHLLNVGGDNYNDDDCDQTSQEDKGLKTGAIVGIVVGATIAVALIIGISIYLSKRRRESKSNKVMQAKLKRLSQTQ